MNNPLAAPSHADSRNGIQRCWINQPSTSQPLHNWHGLNVLAHIEEGETKMATVYPLKGETISMYIPIICLSKGWTK